MRSWLGKIAYTLLTGYILAFYSEWSFWSGRPAAEFFWLEAIPTWIAYSILAYFFLAALVYFRVKSVWALFLAASIYGWLGEGVLVQTMYESLPISISLTGLSWHSLISVLFGFYYLPRNLREGRAWLPSLLAGLALGFWSIGWWQEPEVIESIARLGDGLLLNVLAYNFYFGLLLLPVYGFWLRFDIAEFQPSRMDFSVMLTLALLYYLFVTVPAQPLALVVLPICLSIVLLALWHNRQRETPLEKSSTQPIPFYHLLPLFFIPVLSSIFYFGALSIGLSVPSLAIVYLITIPTGFLVFGMALWKVAFRPKTLAQTDKPK